MVQFTSARSPSWAEARLIFTPGGAYSSGKAVRDLRQDAAIRTSRQSRQEPGQPEVPTQPADGPRDGGRAHLPGEGVHPLLAHVLGGLAKLQPVYLAQAAKVPS